MKVREILESVIEEDKLSVDNYKKLMKMIRSQINSGNLNYVKIKNRVMQRWNDGERLCKKYDMDIIDLQTTVRKLIK